MKKKRELTGIAAAACECSGMNEENLWNKFDEFMKRNGANQTIHKTTINSFHSIKDIWLMDELNWIVLLNLFEWMELLNKNMKNFLFYEWSDNQLHFAEVGWAGMNKKVL